MSNAAPRNVLKKLMATIVLPALCLAAYFTLAPRAKAVEIDFDTYAAMAYSPSTGNYGYAYNHYSQGNAEQAALNNCKADDAKIVGWVQGGWLVLAIGDDNSYGIGWEYGDGANSGVAAQRAIDECHKHTQGIKTIVRICSGDVDPLVVK